MRTMPGRPERPTCYALKAIGEPMSTQSVDRLHGPLTGRGF